MFNGRKCNWYQRWNYNKYRRECKNLKEHNAWKNILVDDISNKTLICAKPLRVGFNKVDRLIRVYDRTKYLVLFGPERYGSIYDRIRYIL